MAVRPDEFRQALASFPSGVTIVTSADATGMPMGITVSSFASLSLEPPLVLVGLRADSPTTAAIRSRRALVVHFLDTRHVELARQFAAGSNDKYAGVPFTWSASGVPMLDDCPLRLECTLEAEHPGGDHVVLVGTVETTHLSAEGSWNPVVYYRRAFRSLGDEVG